MILIHGFALGSGAALDHDRNSADSSIDVNEFERKIIRKAPFQYAQCRQTLGSSGLIGVDLTGRPVGGRPRESGAALTARGRVDERRGNHSPTRDGSRALP
jgi:hypothetical protein